VTASISPDNGLQVNTNVTATSVTSSFTGSFTGDGSQLTGIVSSKWSGSNPITRDGNVEITGSLTVTNGITGSLFGTASWAESASFATSASYSLTASYLDNYVPPFPFTGSAQITGSLIVTGSVQISGTTAINKLQDYTNSTGSSGQILASDGVYTKWTTVKNTSQIQINSEGPTVVSGSKAFKYIDNDEYITKVTIKSVYTGSIQFILKGSGITYGSASLNNNVLYEDSTLIGWNRNIASGSMIEFVVGTAGGSSSGSASTFLFLINTTSKIL
jgi:hypothetical protein